MTDKTQAEALRLAEHCETYITFQYDEQVAAELRRLHALAESQRAELVAEAARTAEEKLRADQMTEQHRMQCNMRKELEQKIASLQEELSSRDSWLAECRDAFTLPAVNTELDHHFCSAMTAPSEVPAYVVAQAKALEAQLSAIGAGGVESLRKRDGQQPQAWLVYLPSCDAQNVYDSRDDAGYIDDLTNNDDAVVTPLYAALQAAPPAERCQGCGYLVTQSEHKSCIRAAARAQEHATQLAGQGQHTDDAAVDALAAAMKAKLARQRAKGYSGWNTEECTQQRLSDMLRTHVGKGDPVDVANFCAFLDARGEGIAPAADGGMAGEYQRWIDFFHKGDGDYDDFLRIDAARAAQGGA